MRRARGEGLTLVEVVIALAILAVMALGLLSMLASSQTMTNVTRERSVATNAVRSYIEAMRTTDLATLLADTTTPADYVPSNVVLTRPNGQPYKANFLKNPVGEVFKVNYESGLMGVLVTGGPGAGVTTPSFTAASLSVPLDATQLGFTSGGRDLDGDGLMTSNPATTSKLLILPARVRLSWTSSISKDATQPQSTVVYVYFSPP